MMQVLRHGQSDYVREFGMVVNPEPMVIKARILEPPVLRYGQGSKQLTIVGPMHNSIVDISVNHWIVEAKEWPMEYVCSALNSSRIALLMVPF